ncbi:unnamed protein product [Prunus armeniaca]
MTEQPKKEIPIKMPNTKEESSEAILHLPQKQGQHTGKSPIQHASPTRNQLEPSQSQGQSGPIPIEGREDWTEEYGQEQMEYDGELDEETEAFGVELECLLQGDLGINMVFIVSEKFRAAEGQENTLEGDVLSQEAFECKLAEVEEALEQQTPTTKTGRTAMKLATEQLYFSKPTKEIVNHLRPLFITANFGGVLIPNVMVDGGAPINLLPHRLLIKMGRIENDLIPTRLIVTNFDGGITKTLTMHCLAGTGSTRVYVFLSLCTSS